MVWTWLEWLNASLALPIALVGFGIAIWQVRDAVTAANGAKSAADAAKSAAEDAIERFKSLSASALIPQLVRLEEAVDVAVERQSVDLLRHVVQNWRWQAGSCREFLDENVEAEAAVMKKIQRSITAATSLRGELHGFSASTDWIAETTKLRKSIGDVTADLGALSAQQTIKEQSN